MEDLSIFFSAVIDDKVEPSSTSCLTESRCETLIFDRLLLCVGRQSFARIKKWLNHAKSSPNLKVIAGGNCDDRKGYFVEPTIVETTDPQDAIMNEVAASAPAPDI